LEAVKKLQKLQKLALVITDYNTDSCTYLRNWTETCYRSEVQAYFEGSAL